MDTHGNFGQMYVAGNATVQALTTTSVKCDDWDGHLSTPAGGATADSGTGDKITVNEPGYYRATLTACLLGINGSTDTVDIRKNGTASAGVIDGTAVDQVFLTNSLTHVVSTHAIVHCNKGDDLSVWLTGSGSHNITVTDAVFTVERIG